jgi:hypothetical protein
MKIVLYRDLRISDSRYFWPTKVTVMNPGCEKVAIPVTPLIQEKLEEVFASAYLDILEFPTQIRKVLACLSKEDYSDFINQEKEVLNAENQVS